MVVVWVVMRLILERPNICLDRVVDVIAVVLVTGGGGCGRRDI